MGAEQITEESRKSIVTVNKPITKTTIKAQYGNFETFEAYCETYGIAQRLGFSSPEHAWNLNPKYQVSADPMDLKVIEVRFGTALLNMENGTIEAPDGTQSNVEALQATRVGDEFWPKGLKVIDFLKADEFYTALVGAE